MKLVLVSLLLMGSQAFAGGAVVSGGKTNSAILVYENALNWETRKLIYAEIDSLFNLGLLSNYESVTDSSGQQVMCAQFKLLSKYNETAATLMQIAENAGVPDSVQSAGACRFDVVN